MTLATKISTAACALVVACLVAVAFPAIVRGSTEEPNVRHSASTPYGTPSAAPGFAGGEAEYDAAVAAMPLPLPDGYGYPEGGTTTVEGTAWIYVWDHWLAATADAALRAKTAGDQAAVAHHQESLRTAWDLHFAEGMAAHASYLGQAIDEQNFAVILQGFPLPPGMKTQ